MIGLTLSSIQDSVIRLMDEHGGNAQFMNGSDNDEIRSIISQVTEDSFRKIHLQAPTAMLDGLFTTLPLATEMIEVNGRYAARVLPPLDFLRLVRVKMESWAHPITQLWWEDSSEYAKQKNKYLMGTCERPVGFFVHHLTTTWMELYSSPDLQDTMSEFIYVQQPKMSDTYYNVSSKLKDACLMQAAADTLTILGETERSQAMQRMADRILVTYGGNERHYADNGNRIEK